MRAQKEAIKERSPEEAMLDRNLEGLVGVHSGHRHSYMRGENKKELNTTEAEMASRKD